MSKPKKKFQRRTDPTPQEIEERAAAIRAEWSEAERQKRLRPDWRSLTDNSTALEPLKGITGNLSRG